MLPERTVDSTRARVLAAARTEFARYGIAGARMDRLAKAARTSKERVYAHFGSKEELYRMVVTNELVVAADATRLDAADLPSYVGRMFDYFASHPECYRLMMWGRLELGSANIPVDDALRADAATKLAQLREAQGSGQLDPAWDVVDVLVLVTSIALAWFSQPDILPDEPAQRTAFLQKRRAVAVAAAERLFPARVTGAGPGPHVS